MPFNNEFGCYYDKQGQFYCVSCKSKDIESPLKKIDDHYKCMVKDCGQVYTKNEEISMGPGNVPKEFKS